MSVCVCLYSCLSCSICKSPLLCAILYVLSFVTCTAVPTLSHKQHVFRGEVIEHKMCFDFLYRFVWNISHSKNISTTYDHTGMLISP
jgi:hypothetical protein